MSYVSILGLLGTFIGLIRAMPQLIQLWRAKSASGVSVDTAAISSVVSFGWAAYGLISDQIYVTLATGTSGLIFAIIAILAIKYGRQLREMRIAPVWLIVILAAAFIFGQAGLAIVLPISVIASNLPQLWIAYHEAELSDLSLGSWLLSLTDGLVWGIYAILQYDIPIMAFGFFQLLTSSFIVGLKLTYINRSKRDRPVIDR